MLSSLSIERLIHRSHEFAIAESLHAEPSLFGVTDGKKIGTYIEHKLIKYLAEHHTFARGSSASGLDIPDLDVDIKVTSIKQPQSSCPFTSVDQKIYGLGYSLLIFVYDKVDDFTIKSSHLKILHTIFIDKERTADYQLTKSIINMLSNDANIEDLISLMNDRNLPLDDITANRLANRILIDPPLQGYLTISNALQWRLQYNHAIASAGLVDGIVRIK